jgi:4-hydroxy-2-oxoglutarate aldolase
VTQGSNGEAVHLTREERITVTSVTRGALDAAGFKDLPIIVGCGAQSTRETIQNCKDAEESGGDYVLILPPSYYKANFRTSQDDNSIYQFFRDVADESPLPVLIYNYPGVVSGIDLNSEAIIRLASHHNIIGCKLTCANLGKLNRIATELRASTLTSNGSGFMCLGGLADITLPVLVSGGSGVITGLGNVAPKACVAIFALYSQGKVVEAQRVQELVARGDSACIEGGIVGTKIALEAYFGYGGMARKPLPKPTRQDVEKWTEAFEEIWEFEKGLP